MKISCQFCVEREFDLSYNFFKRSVVSEFYIEVFWSNEVIPTNITIFNSKHYTVSSRNWSLSHCDLECDYIQSRLRNPDNDGIIKTETEDNFKF